MHSNSTCVIFYFERKEDHGKCSNLVSFSFITTENISLSSSSWEGWDLQFENILGVTKLGGKGITPPQSVSQSGMMSWWHDVACFSCSGKRQHTKFSSFASLLSLSHCILVPWQVLQVIYTWEFLLSIFLYCSPPTDRNLAKLKAGHLYHKTYIRGSIREKLSSFSFSHTNYR